MAWEEIAEGEVVVAVGELEVLGEEVPASELVSASGAVGAVAGHGLLSRSLANEAHVELIQSHLVSHFGHGDTQAAREQCAGGGGGVAVAD